MKYQYPPRPTRSLLRPLWIRRNLSIKHTRIALACRGALEARGVVLKPNKPWTRAYLAHTRTRRESLASHYARCLRGYLRHANQMLFPMTGCVMEKLRLPGKTLHRKHLAREPHIKLT